MKKRIMSGALAALLALGMTGAALAEEAVTLAELKRQAPERLALTVQTVQGDTVAIDMPVALPEEETLPILEARRMTFDCADMREHYPQAKGLEPTVKKAEAAWWYDGTPVLSINAVPQKSRKSKMYRGVNAGRIALPDGETPPGNTMPSTRPLEILYENIRLFGGDDTVDIRATCQYARGGLCGFGSSRPIYNSTIGRSNVDPSKPVKGYEKGLWELCGTQYLRGAPVFDGVYVPYESFWEKNENALEYFPWPGSNVAWISLSVLEEDDFSMGVALLQEEKALVEDAVLAPFGVIQEAIQKRIAQGQLKSAYRLELGYTVCIRREDWPVQSWPGEDTDQRFVLVPAWRVQGYDTKDQDTLPDPKEIPSREAMERDDQRAYELRLDARTGEPLVDFFTDL
ncbi:MAG: hypothetical protein VB099_20065 [Candidatus Limiplasma sp.]|nr:hypothetical protein [Candidatus Limiplasma sp.]